MSIIIPIDNKDFPNCYLYKTDMYPDPKSYERYWNILIQLLSKSESNPLIWDGVNNLIQVMKYKAPYTIHEDATNIIVSNYQAPREDLERMIRDYDLMLPADMQKDVLDDFREKQRARSMATQRNEIN